jgi:hypothetical protein
MSLILGEVEAPSPRVPWSRSVAFCRVFKVQRSDELIVAFAEVITRHASTRCDLDASRPS